MSNGNDSKYRSRKWIMAVMYAGISTLITGFFAYKWKAKPSDVMMILQWYLTFGGVILALYGAASITDKKLNNQGRGGQ